MNQWEVKRETERVREEGGDVGESCLDISSGMETV